MPEQRDWYDAVVGSVGVGVGVAATIPDVAPYKVDVIVLCSPVL
jgi:hypothetical protein